MGESGELAYLLAYVNRQRGIDFSLYRHATIIRKLQLRLQATKAVSYLAYLEYLRTHPEEIENLLETLTIKVTSFFRDPLVFQLLSSLVLPEAMARFSPLRIWSLGCASGEEPYSLAVILRDLMNGEKEEMKVEIIGSDVDAAAIGNAVRGEYPESELAEVAKKYVDKFFQAMPASGPKHLSYRIDDRVRAMVSFETDDIISGLRKAKNAGRKYHIILCRNLLIYMNRALQEEVVSNIADVLCSGGYLVIGESETLPDAIRGGFVQTFPGVKIYLRKPSSP